MRKPRILTIAGKEGRHILRDPRSLAMIFMLPVLMVLLYGYAVNLDLHHIPLSVVDRDRTPLSRLVVERMVASGYFEVTGYYNDVGLARPDIMHGASFGILVFPRDFGSGSTGPGGAKVQLLLDGSDPNTATVARNYFNAFLMDFNSSRRPGEIISVRPRVLYNPELESSRFIVPGLAAIILVLVCALMTSVTITREKETGTLELILTTPVKPYQVIMGKVLPYILIAFIEALVIVALGYYGFGVPLRGSLLLLMGLTLGYVFCALAIGITISALVESQQLAMTIALVATMLPSIILSGFIFPVASMPLPLQVINRFIPATYYIRIIRGIMLKGVGWVDLWIDFVALIAIGLIFLLIGMKKFKTRIA